MTSLINNYSLQRAEEILGYTFRKVDFGPAALFAPHRETDQNGVEIAYDGNRRLALLGRSVIETVLLTRWYISGAERRVGDEILSTVASKDAFADLVLQTGLDSCVRRSKRQGVGIMKPTTLNLTITAFMGAVFLDSDLDYNQVEAVMRTIGFFDIIPL